MKKYIFLLTVFCIFQFTNLQSVAQLTFQKALGAIVENNSLQLTSDSGYIITGVMNKTGYAAFLIKTDANGDTLWAKAYVLAGNEMGYFAQQTMDGGYIVVGYTDDIGAGLKDVYLIKTDTIGNVLWAKAYGGTGYEIGFSVQQTADSGYIVMGTWDGDFGGQGGDIYLIKTNANGDTLWTRTYGGSSTDRGNSVLQTADDGYIIAGYTYSFGEGFSDVYLIKTDSIGDTLWSKTYGEWYGEMAYSIKQTQDDGYIIAGFTGSFGNGGWDVYLIKTDSVGDTLWTKTYGGMNDENGYYVQQTTDGGYVVAGQFDSITIPGGMGDDALLIKTAANGDILWTKTYGGSDTDWANSVQQTVDGGYIVAGNTGSYVVGGGLYLIKTDSSGITGCYNQYNTSTIAGNTTTIVSPAPTIIGSGGTMVAIAAPVAVNMLPIITDACDTIIGIEQLTINNEQIKVYPNPAKETINIKGNIDVPATFELYDLTGRKVLMQSINSNQPINISQLSKGLYVWKIGSVRGKLVVE